MAEFTQEVKKELAILSESGNYSKRVRLMIWNGRKPSLDIRKWSDNGDKAEKGISLNSEEAKKLLEVLQEAEKDGLFNEI